MQVYNTLTRTLETFTPLDGNTVKLYTCGPTVYNYYHIGNLRNAVFNDTLRRTLTISGYDVQHLMNITDVGHLVSDADEGEDKLEKGAAREGKTVWEVAAHYTDAFENDMAAMHVLPPNAYQSEKYGDTYARATEFVDQQLEMVRLLIDKGFAYVTEQAIYFDVAKLPDYGVLTGQRLGDKENAARSEVVSDDQKRSPYDFAVWFFTVGRYEGHSMHWPSPWGDGFPGWHLECSAIIHSVLGDPIDIHTGGIDHIGTHHPNEMAQTEAAFGHELSKYWLHNDFMLVDGAKMAKSAGNSYTLKDIVDKGFSATDYRMLCLQAHYRSELNFSWESLAAARSRLQTYQAFADLRFQPISSGDFEITELDYEEYSKSLVAALQKDLGTPEALRILSLLADERTNSIHADELPEFTAFLELVDKSLGLELLASQDITSEQKQLVSARQQARTDKDWAKSDELRDQLAKQGIGLRDTPNGPLWFRL